jgi:hypothetical protein
MHRTQGYPREGGQQPSRPAVAQMRAAHK